MRGVGRALGRILLALLVAAGALWATAPDERPDMGRSLPAALPEDALADLDAWLAAQEAAAGGVRAGAEKRIVWAGAPGTRTPLAIVYIHGFSASAAEIRPLPDLVAQALGANLFYTRLAGHGQDGPAMATATADAWLSDTAEALSVGRTIGERVIVIGTSTGATLAVLAASRPDMAAGVAGVALVSPNFGLASAAGRILDLPWARVWGPWVAGAERSFEPRNAIHAAGWTTSYPTLALFPMAGTVQAARAIAPSDLMLPALFVFSPEDTVVDATRTEAVAATWGGPATVIRHTPAAGDDPNAHVIAGDAMSPGSTAPLAEAVIAWARGLRL